MTKGLLITFEGIDGCGKSLMQKMTNIMLTDRGYATLMTREPGGSDLGQRFRKMLLDSKYGSVDPNTETLLFMADRSRHVNDVIAPALAEGKIVLCDRYIDSTIAYQGGGRGLAIDRLNALNDFAINGVYPDMTFFLDISVEQAERRLRGEKDRMEQENGDFFRKVAAAYSGLADACPQRIRRINASLDIDGVFLQIKTLVDQLLQDRGLAR